MASCATGGDERLGEADSSIHRSPIENPTEGPAHRVFETGQVRPLAISASRRLLFALNTPDSRVEVFRMHHNSLRHLGSVTVGLEPTALALRNDHELWVVNHLSDSVSIVDVTRARHPRVVRTLLVGDEPRDIVFAGAHRSRAFVTTAHRGQNSPIDPQLTTPGVGRADVWVFEADHLGHSLGGTPETILTFFADTPRALAVTPDGSKVYVAGFLSGNRTTILPPPIVFDPPLPFLPPYTSAAGVPAPPVGVIVQNDGTHWVDSDGGTWDDLVYLDLPDRDVFAIDATADPPAPLPDDTFTSVGTVLFNMVVNPANGNVYVSNLESQNLTRFEGPGTFAGSTVRGHLAESRITVLDGVATTATPRHLNPHIDYATCCAPPGNAEARRSLAFPQQMELTGDGSTLLVAAFGSSKVGVFDTGELESGTFVPDEADHIAVSGGGPAGLALDEQRGRLYVLTRFDNSISVIDLDSRTEVDHVAMFNPEAPSVVAGRRFLYDATFTSSHGDSACASCHINGDNDALAWDLGNPDGAVITNPGPFTFRGDPALNPDFHPMKGPMATQSLRGMANHGPMHWRGDRTGGNDEPSAQPDQGSFDEEAAFLHFNGAFPDLLGRDAPLAIEDMEAFRDFILQVSYPPNPIRNLDNSLTAQQAAGRDQYFNNERDGLTTCNGCHVLDPDGNREFGVEFPGFFGTDGGSTVEPEPQFFKVPHMRNAYTKVGMFGMAPSLFTSPLPRPHAGEQVRGFGFLHDGAFDTVFTFLSNAGFTQSDVPPPIGFGVPIPDGFSTDEQRREVESFIMVFDTNLAPIVGQQVTLRYNNASVAGPRIQLLRERADEGECDLIAKGYHHGREKGYLYIGGGRFQTDRRGHKLHDGQLRARAFSLLGAITYTCVPPGSGVRSSIDRDLDGVLDGDEHHHHH